MKIPDDAIIPDEKLIKYLLVPRPWDDKSKYLAQAGFGLGQPEILRDAIRELADRQDATVDGFNEYGTYWRVEGDLIGPVGSLPVVLIWLQWAIDDMFHFVTLKPRKVLAA
ncbi:MAG: hypothetical protein NT013_03755 [Planctomycetia bacterium]|nr:hypothetical protein [Planctomycetia bacterium]